MKKACAPEEATELMRQHFDTFKLGSEPVSLEDCLGRALSMDINAAEDVPAFTRSTVDGYAVQAADTFGVSQALPAMLEQVGEVKMGESPGFTVDRGQCAYIPTGSQLPEGADCIVMVEHSSTLGEGTIFIEKPQAPGDHLVFKGDDVAEGTTVLPAGTRLEPQDIGALAALGITRLPVARLAAIGVISTGDELVEVDKPVEGAVVRDINTHMLAAAIEKLGARPIRYGIVKDEWDSLKAALQRAIDECDMVLISGGSSMGTRDMTASLIDEAGEPGVFVHGIAIRPGKPTIIGSVDGKPVFGLPGHPVSAYFIYRLFVEPQICRMAGLDLPKQKYVNATLSGNVPSSAGREEYITVRLVYEGTKAIAQPLPYKSGLISSLSSTDGYVRVSRNKEGLSSGEAVEVVLF